MTAEKVIYQESGCYGFSSPGGQPYLIGSQCHLCGYVAFPPRAVCPACVTRGSMQRISLGSKGRVDSFSVLHVSAPDYKAPYVLAWVIMTPAAKVLSMITGCEPSEDSLRIGTEVELVIEKIREDEQGNEIRGYKFRPVG